MYYEDENNLYHYSYRKGDKVENVRDVDYTEVPNTAATADPWEEKKPKKNRLGLKIAATPMSAQASASEANFSTRRSFFWFFSSNGSSVATVHGTSV